MMTENVSATDLLNAIRGFKKEVNLCQIQTKGYDTSLFFLKEFLDKTYNKDMVSVKEFRDKLEKIRTETASNFRDLEKYNETLAHVKKFRSEVDRNMNNLSNRILKIEKILATISKTLPADQELTQEDIEACDLEFQKTKAKVNRIKREKLKEMLIAKT